MDFFTLSNEVGMSHIVRDVITQAEELGVDTVIRHRAGRLMVDVKLMKEPDDNKWMSEEENLLLVFDVITALEAEAVKRTLQNAPPPRCVDWCIKHRPG